MQSSSAAAVTHQQPMHLWDYWGIVMKRFWLVLLFAAVSVTVAWLITESQEPQYSSVATLELIPPSQYGGDPFMPSMATDQAYMDTQVAKLRLRSTIERAVKTQKLAENKVFSGRSEADIVRMAAGRVNATPQPRKLLLDVSVIGPDPRVLPVLTEALVAEFRSMQQTEGRRRRELARQDLDSRKSKLVLEERLASQDLRTALDNAHLSETTLDVEYGLHSGRLNTRTLQKDGVNDRLSHDRVMFEAVKAAREQKSDPVAGLLQFKVIQDDPNVREITRAIEALRDQQDDLRRRGVGAELAEYRGIEREIERKVIQKERAVLGAADDFILNYRADEQRLLDLDRELQVVVSRVQELNKLKLLVDEKRDAISKASLEIAHIEKQLEPIRTSQLDEVETMRLIQPASYPTEPFSPNRSMNLTLGAVVGLLGGVSIAFLLDYLDDTIRSKDELAKVADVPLLGVVPNIRGRATDMAKKDLFAHENPKSTISEAYRGVRTALTLSTRGPTQRVMVLTSAGPREGKTTTAINLATVLAYSGARTLVIDADLRKPRIHKSFGMPNSKGLTNLIIGDEDPRSLCVPTQVDRVDLLPSGPIPPNPSELLGNPRMREILQRLREHYDHIIVDTPPIGAVTDAAVLATVADGVILVVHAGKTRRQIVVRGIEQLRYINATIIGVILNNLRIGRIRYYPGYYHYYYYYSSHYGADEPASSESPAAASGEVDGPGKTPS